MRPFALSWLAFLLLMLATTNLVSAASITDDKAIHAIADRWKTAWNTHDVVAMGVLLTDDADFGNLGGNHWKGRAQIVAEHTKRHETNLKNSIWETRELTVQMLSGSVALVHVN